MDVPADRHEKTKSNKLMSGHKSMHSFVQQMEIVRRQVNTGVYEGVIPPPPSIFSSVGKL